MDFVILKVNGRDLSHATHEEAVHAFLTAQEPITIEVLRRKRCAEPASTSTATTDDSSDDKKIRPNVRQESNKGAQLAEQTDSGSCICPRCGFNPASPTDTQQISGDQEGAAHLASSSSVASFDVLNTFMGEDGLLADEVDFKVTITKLSHGPANVIFRNLGDDERGQNRYVVVEQVIDLEFKKLREGDRLLEINGIAVQNAEHASSLVNCHPIGTLEFSIQRLPDDEDDGDSVEELRMLHLEDYHGTTEGIVDEEALDDALNSHEKDSGLAESCKNDDSSENDLLSPRSSKYNTSSSGGCCDLDAEDLVRMNDTGMQTDFDFAQPLLQQQRQSSLNSIENELIAVSRQMEKIQLQCQAIPEAAPHFPRPPKPPRNPRTSSLSTRTAELPASSLNRKTRKTTSRSQLEPEGALFVPARPGLVKMSSPEFFEFPPAPKFPVQPNQLNDVTLNKTRVEISKVLNGGPIHVPYGSPINTESRQTRTQAQPVAARPSGRTKPHQLKTVREEEEMTMSRIHIYEQIQDEKSTECLSLQRSSGAKSASKRPVRNKLLQDRASRIAQERCGMTTDDDAMSEMKIGRYWSKEEKRQQLENIKDYKRQREIEKFRLQLMAPTDTNKILALSKQKLLKKKSRQIDDFMTVQEVLANRNPVDQRVQMNGLTNVNVTTV